MRLLASVHSLVNSESRSLDESLVTFGIVANVRSDSGVNTLYEHAFVRKKNRLRTLSLQSWLDLPWRARSLLLANPLPQVLQGYALTGAVGAC